MNILELFLPNSPFKTPKLKFYFGRIKHGTPYFLPRVWKKSKTQKGYKTAKTTKWLNFQIIPLGWKTKWNEWDFRFEWNPMISIVFCHLQFCIWIIPIHHYHYWECWLAYKKMSKRLSDMSMEEILSTTKIHFPCIWETNEGEIDYWKLILKPKYVNE